MAKAAPKPRRDGHRRALRILRSSAVRAAGAWLRGLAERPARTATLALAVLTVVAAGATGARGLGMLQEQQEQRAALSADLDRLRAEAAELRQAIERLENDPAAIELLAKTNHHLVEPGEVVLLLRFPERTGPPRPERPPDDSPAEAYSIR